jgi:type VI secretion system protein ImpM
MSGSALGEPHSAGAAVEAAGAGVGFYGKLPGHADFVRRGLAQTFIDPWDRWLAQAMQDSAGDLGADWLACYLTAPLWRFALSPGCCGPVAATGVLLPSVDAVNRHFPLTIALLLPCGALPLATVAAGDAWFSAIEELALAALDRPLAADALAELVHGVALPETGVIGSTLTPASLAATTDAAAWRITLSADAQAIAGRDLLTTVAEATIAPAALPWSLWWTAGSDNVAPGVRLCRSGLPAPGGFAAMLRDSALPPLTTEMSR